MSLGQYIKSARESKDLTQLELAKKLGYDNQQFVYLMESGNSKVPLKVAGKLIVILGLAETHVKNLLLKEYENDLYFEIKAGKKEIKN